MATSRKLTIAGMSGTFKLRFKDISNHDTNFRFSGGGKVSVERSDNGTTYIVKCNTSHFRVYAQIITPDDLPTLYYWDDNNDGGWWHLEGFDRVNFKPGNWPDLDANSLSLSDDFGQPSEVASNL